MEEEDCEKEDDENVRDEDWVWAKTDINLDNYKCIFQKLKGPI